MTPQTFNYQLGQFDITVLRDGGQTHSAATYFPNVPPTLRDAAIAETPYDATALDFPFQPLLVDTPHGRVLIDAGNGGDILGRLAEIEVSPASIDVVILTHAHGDHYRGLLNAEGVPHFPRARYVMWGAEWQYYASDEVVARLQTQEPERYADMVQSFYPLCRALTLVDANNAEILPGVRLEEAPGHTAHHSVVWLESEGASLLFVSDAFIHPLSIEYPEWAFFLDENPALATQTRYQLLERAAAHQSIVHGYHFTMPALGTVQALASGYRWVPLLETILA